MLDFLFTFLYVEEGGKRDRDQGTGYNPFTTINPSSPKESGPSLRNWQPKLVLIATPSHFLISFKSRQRKNGCYAKGSKQVEPIEPSSRVQ